MFIPQPFQVVFSEGQNTSTSCANILVLRDNELEDDEHFTISIISAGTEPYARILSPSVLIVTIHDIVPSDTTPHQNDENLSLQWVMVILILSCVVVGATSCFVAILLYHCISKQKCCKLSTTEGSHTYETARDVFCLENNVVTNEAYSRVMSRPPLANDQAIITSPNHTVHVQAPARPCNLQIEQPVPRTSSTSFSTNYETIVDKSFGEEQT